MVAVMLLSRMIYSLLCFSVLSGLLCSCGTKTDAVPLPLKQSLGPADKVEVAYFHRHRRCEACTYAEERINYIVKTYFQAELESGNLTFGIYDIEDKDSIALAKKFGALGSQLFVNRIKDGVDNIRYIEEIWYWGCIDNEEVFDRTVSDVIERQFMVRDKRKCSRLCVALL
jgi:hypothetical protein